MDNHGDVLARAASGNFADSVTNIDGIEPISTQMKLGGVGMQRLTIDAGSVQQLSDDTTTSGGLFAEQESIRIDADIVDQLHLSVSRDGGRWVDSRARFRGCSRL